MDATPRMPERLTLVALAALAYVVEVALHEHLGHAASCVLLGSRPIELGAFYVNCDDSLLSATAIRFVALAGPFVSLLVGVACFGALRASAAWGAATWLFTWLLGTLGWMTATGYLLFSGVGGIGDLGTTVDGALHGVQPEWLVRVALAATGAGTYWLAVKAAVRRFSARLPERGPEHARLARSIAWTCYYTGAVVYLLVGLRNPYGLVIVLTSALASSMGGTSGLLWMMKFVRPDGAPPGAGVYFPRHWGWISAAVAITAAYAVVFGPTLRP
jgi:hypothetical protein